MFGFIKKKLQEAAVEQDFKKRVERVNKAGGATILCVNYLSNILSDEKVHHSFLCGFGPNEKLKPIYVEVRFAAACGMTEARKDHIKNSSEEALKKLELFEKAFEYTFYHLTDDERHSVTDQQLETFEKMRTILESEDTNILLKLSPYRELIIEKMNSANEALNSYRRSSKEQILSFKSPVKI